MPDKYDRAIEYLTEHPDEIDDAWGNINDHKAGCLFQYVSPSEDAERDANRPCGCLTQVKAGVLPAWTEELESAIAADHRIPDSAEDITVKTLPIFAEWQRLLDKELNRA